MSDDIMRVDTQGHDPYMQLDLLAQAKAANLLPDNVIDRLTRLVFANAGLYAGGTTDARADVPKGTCTANHPKPATAERMEGAGLPVSDMTRRLSIADYLRGRTLPGYTDPAYARRAFGKKLRKAYEETYGYEPPCIDRGGYTAYGYVEADRPLFDKVFEELSDRVGEKVTFQ